MPGTIWDDNSVFMNGSWFRIVDSQTMMLEEVSTGEKTSFHDHAKTRKIAQEAKKMVDEEEDLNSRLLPRD